MHAAAHRAQMKDMLDEKKREEEGKEIRHQRVVAKMQKKIDFLEDELLRERQLSRSLTDALLKGRAQYASSSASAAEPKPRRATFLAEVDISQPSTSKQQSCHFGAAATSPGIVFESLDGKVQKIAMQDIWVNSVFENDPAIEFVTLEQATSQAQASGEKQPAATAASHDLGEILLDAAAEDSGENLLDAAVEDPEENLPDAAAEDSEEDLPDAAVQVPQENPPPAVAQAHHLQPSYEYDSDIEFNVVDGQFPQPEASRRQFFLVESFRSQKPAGGSFSSLKVSAARSQQAAVFPRSKVLALVGAPGQQEQQRLSNLAIPMAQSNFSSGGETLLPR
ncbi:uncharacterized protein ISCGN_010221 [Ixodes scapularis]